jgi:outer membrane protein assembly factor BamB
MCKSPLTRLVVSALVFSVALTACTRAGNAPTARTPTQTVRTPSLEQTPPKVWSATVQCVPETRVEEAFNGCRSPVIIGNRVVWLSRIGDRHTFTALDANTGQLVWTKDAKQAWWISGRDGVLIAESDEGSEALDPTTGAVIWTTKLRIPSYNPASTITLSGSSLVADSFLLVEQEPGDNTKGWTHRVLKQDGRSLWRAEGTPIATCGDLVATFTFLKNDLAVVEAATGSPLWHLSPELAASMYGGAGYKASRIIQRCVGDTFYLYNGESELVALEARTGVVRWRFAQTDVTSIGIDGDNVWASLSDDSSVVLSATDGTVRQSVANEKLTDTNISLTPMSSFVDIPIDRATGEIDLVSPDGRTTGVILGRDSEVFIVDVNEHIVAIKRSDLTVRWSIDVSPITLGGESSTGAEREESKDYVVVSDGLIVVQHGDQIDAYGDPSFTRSAPVTPPTLPPTFPPTLPTQTLATPPTQANFPATPRDPQPQAEAPFVASFDHRPPDRQPQQLWALKGRCRPPKYPSSRCDIAVIGNRVFVFEADITLENVPYVLTSFAAESGRELWSRPIVEPSPVHKDPRVLELSTLGGLLTVRNATGFEAIDPVTGATLWETSGSFPSPFQGMPDTFVTGGDNTTNVISRANGSSRWIAKGTPAATCGEYLALVEGGAGWSTSTLRVVDAATGVEKWNRTGAEVSAAEGKEVNLYTGYHQCTKDTLWLKSDDPDIDNSLRAFDLKTGDLRWTVAFAERGRFQAFDDRVLVVTDATSVALSALDGHEIWRRQGHIGRPVEGIEGLYADVESQRLFHVNMASGMISDISIANATTPFFGFAASGAAFTDRQTALVWASDTSGNVQVSGVEIDSPTEIRQIWAADLGRGDFAVGGGRVVVASTEGLIAYG